MGKSVSVHHCDLFSELDVAALKIRTISNLLVDASLPEIDKDDLIGFGSILFDISEDLEILAERACDISEKNDRLRGRKLNDL